MARQIIPTSAEPSVQELEHRIAVLERQIAALAEASRVLAAALEGTPLDTPDGDAKAAARRAHEMLLLPPLAS
ncbi:hypothetical protein [Actinomadura macra]|uniref:hypothetical protein n=1 Tax=Actinomadura macra TaxID=46164 RepID=UPI00082EF19B|nr:hypothetical protein [Actinomadura macra]